jgi:hypothetical protein
MPITCPECEGNEYFYLEDIKTGREWREECSVCKGRGELWTKEEIKRKKQLLHYARKHWDEDFDSILHILVRMKQRETDFETIVKETK